MSSHAEDVPILQVENLRIDILDRGITISPVKGISFSVAQKRVTAVVGESGSGKTLTALAIMGLLPSTKMAISKGSRIRYLDKDILALSDNQFSGVRGKEIAMIFQDPNSSLNPVMRIGEQLVQPLRKHLGLSKSQAQIRAVELLQEVGIHSPEVRVHAYPHELSGGQKQRVMIAMAISCKPKLLIADEPTSALDVTVQRQILGLIARLQREYGLSVLFITHDLGVAAEMADQVVVMRKGEIKEEGDKDSVLFAPSNDYTRDLVESRTRLVRGRVAQSGDTGRPSGERGVLSAKGLSKDYITRLGWNQRYVLPAVKDVSLTLHQGETIGIVGESGSGKTTLAMMVVRLVKATSGSVFLGDQEILHIVASDFRPLRRRIQVVFQNPYASLNPRWSIRRTLTTPMKLHGLGTSQSDRENRATGLLERVGLSRRALDKYPHQFSGGERQRIAIARCLTVEPEILICDECVSALDITNQLQVLDLLCDLQAERGMSYLFISHDLAVVRYIADRVLVMQNGEIVENSGKNTLFSTPSHPYTRQLLAAIPAKM